MSRPARVRLRIPATQVVWGEKGQQTHRVRLPEPPVGNSPPLEAIFGAWWLRAGGYAPGLLSGTVPVRREAVHG